MKILGRSGGVDLMTTSSWPAELQNLQNVVDDACCDYG